MATVELLLFVVCCCFLQQSCVAVRVVFMYVRYVSSMYYYVLHTVLNVEKWRNQNF